MLNPDGPLWVDRLSEGLSDTGERFEGLPPPVVAAPAFAIRKPAVAVFTLQDYVDAGTMTAKQAEILRQAVADRCNILVAGGKATLTNALLAEVSKTSDRVVLIEDTLGLRAGDPLHLAVASEHGTTVHTLDKRLAERSNGRRGRSCWHESESFSSDLG